MIVLSLRTMTAAIAALVVSITFLPISPAQAGLVAKVDLSAQRMKVYVDGKHKYTWRVSTGKKGYKTPRGSFTPYKMKALHVSKKWNMKLPHTIWVNGSVAVHGTYMTRRLGRTASHGCIRLAPRNAKRFYALVKKHGMWFTTVKVHK